MDVTDATCRFSLKSSSTDRRNIDGSNQGTYATPIVWFTVELNGGVTSACLPTLRPLVQLMHPYLLKTFRSTRGSKLKQSSGHSTERAWPGSKGENAAISDSAISVPTLPPIKVVGFEIDMSDIDGEGSELRRLCESHLPPAYDKLGDATEIC